MSKKLEMDKDGEVSIKDQAEMLIDNIGTDREWTCLGYKDEDGIGEVLALCHPVNAQRLVDGFNEHAALRAVADVLVSIGETAENAIHQNLSKRDMQCLGAPMRDIRRRAFEALTTLETIRGKAGR